MASLLQARNLTKTYSLRGSQTGVIAVDDVSLSIEPGQIVGLVGESGSGKSSLGKLLVGLETKTAGQVLFDGEPLPDRYSRADFQRLSEDIQMVFQDPYASLNPRMTVEEILTEPLKLQGGVSRGEAVQRAREWLQKVNLDPNCLSRYPHEFSGGQRQRLGIARALIRGPRLLVCDEPVSALDVSVQAQVINVLKQLQQEMGLAILFIAHDLSMVRYLCDHVWVMYLGRIVERAKVEDVFTAPKHPYTRELLASNPLPDPRTERERVFKPTRSAAAPFTLAGCRFAPRCPEATDRCLSQQPSAVTEGASEVACWLYAD